MAEISQNRIVSALSGQSISSKWWCSGVNRKTRRPGGAERYDLDDNRGDLGHEQGTEDDG